MMKSSRANRGRAFEEFLKFVHERYRNEGLAVVHKVPTEFIPLRGRNGQVCGCKVEHKSCVDFLGRYKTIAIAIEAKHTESDRIALSRVEKHQAEFLDMWDTCGVASLVLVSFGLKRFFAVPWMFWKTACDTWKMNPKKKVEVIAYGWRWITPGMASVSADQLLPDWEIKAGGKTGLPYMAIIDKIITKGA